MRNNDIHATPQIGGFCKSMNSLTFPACDEVAAGLQTVQMEILLGKHYQAHRGSFWSCRVCRKECRMWRDLQVMIVRPNGKEVRL